MMRTRWVILAMIAAAACGDDGNKVVPDARLEGFDKPDIVCPGDPDCMSAGDGVLKVDGDVGNKSAYDPRSYLALAERAMAERVARAATDLRSAGMKTIGSLLSWSVC